MAKIIYNKGFRVVKFDNSEISKLGFGFPTDFGSFRVCLCNQCNIEILGDYINYIPVLNDTICDNCLNHINLTLHKDDYEYEGKKIEMLKNIIEIKE